MAPPTSPQGPPSTQDPADVHHRQVFVFAVTTVLMILSTLTVIFRLWARFLTRQRLRSDDYFMLVALPFSYIDGICNFLALSVGLGKHVRMVSKPDQVIFRKIFFALQRGNPPCLFCVKTSILLFYMHLFPTRNFKRAAWGMVTFTGLWAFAAFFSNLMQCTPISFFWDKTIKDGHCLNLTAIGVANASLSLAGDVAILFMPLPMIWKLQLNMRKKLALTGIFLLGAFVCVISLIRILLLPKLDLKDPTFSQVYPGTLTYAELGVAIICGNLPVMGPLFGRWFRDKMSSYKQKHYGLQYPGQPGPVTSIRANPRDGFARMNDSKGTSHDDSGSDVELAPQKPGLKSYGIEVTTDIAFDFRKNSSSRELPLQGTNEKPKRGSGGQGVAF